MGCLKWAAFKLPGNKLVTKSDEGSLYAEVPVVLQPFPSAPRAVYSNATFLMITTAPYLLGSAWASNEFQLSSTRLNSMLWQVLRVHRLFLSRPPILTLDQNKPAPFTDAFHHHVSRINIESFTPSQAREHAGPEL